VSRGVRFRGPLSPLPRRRLGRRYPDPDTIPVVHGYGAASTVMFILTDVHTQIEFESADPARCGSVFRRGSTACDIYQLSRAHQKRT
jgi:hypothetical protein